MEVDGGGEALITTKRRKGTSDRRNQERAYTSSTKKWRRRRSGNALTALSMEDTKRCSIFAGRCTDDVTSETFRSQDGRVAEYG